MPLNEGAINEILPFAAEALEDAGDVLSLEAYKNHPMRLRGHMVGLALREMQNIEARQATHMAAGVAQFVANRHAPGVVDDGDLDKVEEGLLQAIIKTILENTPEPVNPIPKGVITLWSGAVTAIPTGWALCNGLNDTPDLRDRFVVGAGSSYTVGLAGGTINHVHGVGVGEHTLAEWQIPAHIHQNTLKYISPNGAGGGGSSAFSQSGTVSYYPTNSTGGSGAHNHSAWSDTQDHRPPYFALCYIMKL